MSAAPFPDVAVVMPVFNDWAALSCLLDEIDAQEGLAGTRLHVLVIDDGSREPCPSGLGARPWRLIASLEVVRLACNLGHQRALAVGLVLAEREPGIEAAVVMDADGEDQPQDLPRLLAEAAAAPDTVVCAQRTRRSEGLAFRSFYSLYKLAFQVLTGARIDFGNFCVLRRGALENLVSSAATWNHIAGAVMRSRLPLRRVSTARGKRYAGRSRMSMIGLLLHGLSAISVFADVVLARIVLCTCALSLLAAVTLVLVTGLKLFTDLAIPGWASVLGAALVGIMLQLLVLSALATFQLLALRSSRPFVPALDAMAFVKARMRLPAAGAAPPLVPAAPDEAEALENATISRVRLGAV
jgi:hypothetical protein